MHCYCDEIRLGPAEPVSPTPEELDRVAKHILKLKGNNMKVRAKFRVDSVEINEHSDIVKFSAVYGGSTNAEDNSFSEATPSASCSMTVSNKAVRGQFKPGQKFYVDFAPAE